MQRVLLRGAVELPQAQPRRERRRARRRHGQQQAPQHALEPQRVSEKLHQHTFWTGRGGSVTHAISGIDIALWDILGKITGLCLELRIAPSIPAFEQELLAGRIQVGGDQLSSSLAEIKAGTLKALATTATTRIAGLPDVPTVRELGFPGLELEGWNGLFAPAKTPKDIIDRLQRETAAAVRHPEVMKRLVELGAEPVGSSPAEQNAMLKNQMDQFRSVIKEMRLE